ncbi:DUF4232 domain-containing protein [Actinacidiphila glaucinigra]|nr:DUF4232 domain-containing protein [Actinacidiphila glaucinigra]
MDLTAMAGRFAERQPGGRVGEYLAQIVLRNASHGTCSLQGWAGLEVFGDGIPVVCNGADDPNSDCGKGPDTTKPRSVTVTRVPGLTADLVVLAPGEQTSYGLLWSDERRPECDATGGWAPPYGARVRIPGDSRPLTAAPLPDMWACGGLIRLMPIGLTFPPFGGSAGGTG